MKWTGSCKKHTLEIAQKGEILIDLLDNLVKSKGKFHDHIFIHYSGSFYQDNKVHTNITYGEDTYRLNNKKSDDDKTAKGIIVDIHDYDLSITIIVNKINIFLDSLSGNKIDTSLVSNLLKRKIYRNKKQASELNELDYYFEGSKFHFYRLEQPNDTSAVRVNSLFSVDNVYEVYGNSLSEGYFIFTTDSNFLFLRHDKLSKPLRFNWRPFKDSSHIQRSAIQGHEIEYFYDKNEKFVQKFVLHYNFDSKALFIPHENFVKTDYQDIEWQFINSLIHKPTVVAQINSKDNSKIWYYILGVLLFTSMVLNLFLWRKK
jgi:hypothetical protein